MTRKFLSLLAVALSAYAADPSLTELRRGFENPPDDARIMMRWWWFGPSVTKPELEREMRAMKAGGIGGFEVQPVYPLALDDPEKNFRNYSYLSPEFLDALKFTSEKARELGLRMDLTLGSGWPFGGPHIPATESAGKLRCDRVPVPPGATRVPLPDLAAGEKLIAAFVARGEAKFTRIENIAGDALRLPAENQPRVVLFFVSSRTGQMVKRPSVGAEGFVLDHMDRRAIETHLKTAGEPMLRAIGPNPPYAIFSDSLEVYGSDWTPGLLDEFRKRRGYDLLPLLPALVGDIGDQTAFVRHDWAKTLTELVEENYIEPLKNWAHANGTRLRSQTYGTPAVSLSSAAHSELMEGESPHWRRYSQGRLASSAAHLYGRPVVSSETWTWLHSPAFAATPLDMKAEADLHFILGINQLVGHGWPYSPDEVAGQPGWRFYAAAVFNDHNPWWIVMPELARYLQRMSWLLRQGKPANDVAIYLPTSDARASLMAGQSSLDPYMHKTLGDELIPGILDAGYNFDFIDDEAIDKLGVGHPVLILPRVERMPLAILRKIDAYARGGGIVLAVGRAPSLAPGLKENETDTPQIRELAKSLRVVASDGAALRELQRRILPDVASSSKTTGLGFIHRKLDWGDIYFIVNTENRPIHSTLTFRVKRDTGAEWNPFTAEQSPEGGSGRDFNCEPYGSRVIVLRTTGSAGDRGRQMPPPPPPIDLSAGWTVRFPDKTVAMPTLRSWTDDEDTRYFSGQAIYEKTVTVPKSEHHIYLNFGEGTPLAHPPQRGNGMRAWIDGPVRDAALVYVNGKLAGSVWRPPYEIDITDFLSAGENRIRIAVANTAINQMAGRPLPDYRLLNLRYGERFTAQDMQDVKPAPSGLLGPVRLVAH